MNAIAITGNLVRSPEAREASTPMLTFTVAVNRKYRNREGVRETDFFDVTTFGKLAELLAGFDLQKGTTVAVTGSMQSRKYQDKQGNNRTAWSLHADDVQIIGGKQAAQTLQDEGVPDYRPDNSTPLEQITDDDLPF